MKKLKLLSILVISGVVFLTSCAKDGAVGPIGADGAAGSNGTNGSLVTAADQAAYDAADMYKGGLAFNVFYLPETGFPQPVDTLYTASATKAFFQCTACHGRDLLGRFGNYINRAPSATRPEVASHDLRAYGLNHNIREIFNAVKNTGGRSEGTLKTSLDARHPDYGKIMTDAFIWNIVKFLKEGTVNNDAFYNLTTTGTYPTGTSTYTNVGKNGDVAAGTAYYNANCKSCHGTTGNNGAFSVYMSHGAGYYMRNEPYFMFFQLKYGRYNATHPEMLTINSVGNITQQEGVNLYKAMSDTIAFPNL